MKIKFFLHGPVLVEWEVPDPTQFNFVVMCKSIRADGYFVAPSLYIPEREIISIGIEGVTIVAPTTETKQ